MEHAVPLPQCIFFDLSRADLRCFSPAPAVEHIGVSYDTQVMGLGGTSPDTVVPHRPRNSPRPSSQDRHLCGHAQISDPDTVSDAGKPGVQVVEETGDESEDEVVSLEELFYDESLVRKIDALAELVGVKANLETAVVLGSCQGAPGDGAEEGAFCVCNEGRLIVIGPS